jgi:hypothetical protein
MRSVHRALFRTGWNKAGLPVVYRNWQRNNNNEET